MIHLTVLNLETKLFEGDVSAITLPGKKGELTVLPGHLPIITLIKTGAIKAILRESNRYGNEADKYFESTGGIFEFSNNNAAILL